MRSVNPCHLLAVWVLLALGTAEVMAQTVDINTADAQTLARVLNGVGMAVATEIVAYREANGPFTRIDDLVLVRGIGTALLERNRERLALGPPPGAAEGSTMGTRSPSSD